MDTLEIALRLGLATLVGAALGLNREIHGKPTGVRTLGLVGLGSALAVMAATATGDIAAPSRVMQGIVTGIGFLGAGVILRPTGKKSHTRVDHGGVHLAHRRVRHRLRGQRMALRPHRRRACFCRAPARRPVRKNRRALAGR